MGSRVCVRPKCVCPAEGAESIVIDLVEKSPELEPVPRLPSGWYDPDSSAFEPLAGTSAMSEAMNETMARSVEADRTIDAPAEDADRT